MVLPSGFLGLLGLSIAGNTSSSNAALTLVRAQFLNQGKGEMTGSFNGRERLWEVMHRVCARVLRRVGSGGFANPHCPDGCRRARQALFVLPRFPLQPGQRQWPASPSCAVLQLTRITVSGTIVQRQITEEGKTHFLKGLCWFWVFWELFHSRDAKPLQGHSWKHGKLHKGSKGWEGTLQTVFLPKKKSP